MVLDTGAALVVPRDNERIDQVSKQTSALDLTQFYTHFHVNGLTKNP
jgi:hypothetical protein